MLLVFGNHGKRNHVLSSSSNFCSGYADRIYELMAISRELGPRDVSSPQTNGTKNYVSEANYIEFDNVKVILVHTYFFLGASESYFLCPQAS